jgi:hypothetical protein
VPRARQIDRDDVADPAGARRHHDHPVGEEHRLGDAVRDEQHRLAALVPDPQELEVHRLARHRVERAERFVHQEQRRLVDERAADADALLHAARELAGVLALEAGEPDEPQVGTRARLELDPVAPLDLDRQHHVLEHVAPRQQDRRLEDDADVAARPVDRALAEAHVTRRAAQDPGEDLEERALPAAARADDGHELAVADVEADVLQRLDVPAFERAVDLVEARDRDELRRRRRRRGGLARRRRAVERGAHFTGQLAACARIAAASKLLIFS